MILHRRAVCLLRACRLSTLWTYADRYGLAALPLVVSDRGLPAALVTPKNRTLSTLVERFIVCAREVEDSMVGNRNRANHSLAGPLSQISSQPMRSSRGNGGVSDGGCGGDGGGCSLLRHDRVGTKL